MESSDGQIEELRKKLQDAEEKAASASSSLESTQKELERALPFEKEAKEKNLLIGKLRHEAVTLNEHLTKALRFLKKGKLEDNVDRYARTHGLPLEINADNRVGTLSQTTLSTSSRSTVRIQRSSKSCSS